MGEFSTNWVTTNGISTTPTFHEAADVTYGGFYCLCFLIGTLGNIVSFLYFISKKMDISNVLYTMITVNDVVISIIVLPVGMSLWSDRRPGLLFGSEGGCAAWAYLWHTAVASSIFLVLCLSISRTISLVRPFKEQSVKCLIVSIVVYISLTLAMLLSVHIEEVVKIDFHAWDTRCDMVLISKTPGDTHGAVANILEAGRNTAFLVPALLVAISSIISAVLLARGSEHQGLQKDIQRSSSRATVTVLLFALLYGICNVPVVIDRILLTYSRHAGDMSWYRSLYRFDTQFYYYNIIITVLPAANSAANPILFFLRMPALREFIMTGIRRLFGLNKKPTSDQGEQGNRLIQKSDGSPDLPATTAKTNL